MKVGIVGFGFGLGATGGTQVYARELVTALDRHAAPDTSYVVLLLPSDSVPAPPAPSAIRFIQLDWPGRRPPSEWRVRLQKILPDLPGLPPLADPLSAAIDGIGLDVVHYPVTRMTELSLRTPAVLTFFDMQEEFLPGFFSRRERLARSVQNRRATAKAALIISPSGFTARSLIERYGVSTERIVQVPVGLSEGFARVAGAGERERLRARYHLPDGDFLLYPANPWPHKNHLRLLAALSRVERRLGERVRLVCTGRLRDERRAVVELARRAGIEADRVCDLGFVEPADMPVLYRAARMLVFPSLFEGFGMPVLEAMACGCPVACAGTTALPELVGDAARLFDPTDEEAIAEAITDVWTDEARRTAMREKGLTRAEGYRWSRIVPRILDVYRRAAGMPRG